MGFVQRLLLGGLSAIGLLAASVSSGEAAVTINVTEGGGNVVFNVSGSLNLTGATALDGGPNYNPGIIPGGNNWYIATGSGGAWQSYALTSFAGAFGTSVVFNTSYIGNVGDTFSIWGRSGVNQNVFVDPGYVSGSALNASLTYAGTIASLSLTPGSYLYTIPNDTITLNIGGPRSVPVPAALSLVGVGLAFLGFVGWRRKQVVAG